MASPLAVLIEFIAKKDESIDYALKGISSQLSSLSKMIATDFAYQIAGGIGQVSSAIIGMGKTMVAQASQMETYRVKLETVLHSTAAARQSLSEAIAFAAKTPFNIQQIVDANTMLTIYGTNAKITLPLVADLAAGMGKDISEAAYAIGRAWTGSSEGMEILRRNYGVTIQKLKQFGAEVNAQGQVLSRTPQQIEKIRNALTGLIKTEYSGAIDRQAKTFAGALSNMEDAISRLMIIIGERLIPAMTAIAKTITKTIEWFEGISPATKNAIIAIGVFSAAITGIIAAGSGVIIMIGKTTESLRLMGVEWNRAALFATSATQTMIANTIALQSAIGTAVAKQSTAISGGAIAGMLTPGALSSVTSKMTNLGIVTAQTRDVATGFMDRIKTLIPIIARFAGVIGIAVVAGTTLLLKIKEEEEISRNRADRLQEESKQIIQNQQIWRNYAEAIDSATKSGIKIGGEFANMEERLKSLQIAIENVDISKLVTILTGKGISTEEAEKTKEAIEAQSEALKKDIKILETYMEVKKRTRPTFFERAIAGTFAMETRTPVEPIISEKTVLRQWAKEDKESAKYFQTLVQGLKTEAEYEALLAERRKSLEALLPLQKTAGFIADTLKKDEYALASITEQIEKFKAYYNFAEQLKDTQGLNEKLKDLKTQLSNAREVMISIGLPSEPLKVLEALKTETNETRRQILSTFLEIQIEYNKTQNSIIQQTKQATREREEILEAEFDRLMKMRERELHKIQALGQISPRKEAEYNKQTLNEIRKFQDQYASELNKLPGLREKINTTLYQGEIAYYQAIQAEQKLHFTQLQEKASEYLQSQDSAGKRSVAQQIIAIQEVIKWWEDAIMTKKISVEEGEKEIRKNLLETDRLQRSLIENQKLMRMDLLNTIKISLDKEISMYIEKTKLTGKDYQNEIIEASQNRLKIELAGIELSAQKELEANQGNADAQEIIIQKLAILKKNALESEKANIQQIIDSLKSKISEETSRLDEINKKYEGQKIGGITITKGFASLEQMVEQQAALFAEPEKRAIPIKTQSLEAYIGQLGADITMMSDSLGFNIDNLSFAIDKLTNAILSKTFGGEIRPGETVLPSFASIRPLQTYTLPPAFPSPLKTIYTEDRMVPSSNISKQQNITINFEGKTVAGTRISYLASEMMKDSQIKNLISGGFLSPREDWY